MRPSHRTPLPLDTSGFTSLDRIAGRMVTALRLGRSITVAELAERSGLAVEEITAYERGDRSLPLAALYRLAPVLGITPHLFMTTLAEVMPGR